MPSPSQPVPTGPTLSEVIELRILQLENEVYKLTQRVADLEHKSGQSPPTPANMVLYEHTTEFNICAYCYKYPSMALRFQCIICTTEACRYCLEKRQVSLPSPSQPVPTGPTRSEVIELRILQLENEVYKLTQRVADLEHKSGQSPPTPANMVLYEHTTEFK